MATFGEERATITAVSAVRSRIMRSVNSEHTGPEMMLRRVLWKSGLRYRVHPKIVGCTPDLAFTRSRVAVFVDGCFWHGCPIHYGRPKSNVEFWTKKLAQNQLRDTRDRLRLEAADWTVLRFWQCEIKTDVAGVRQRIESALRPTNR
jgi:DNA mismatch endonuclease (patch repair protein)